MSKFAILLIGIVFIAVVTANQDDQAAWDSYKLRFHKHYKTAAEEQMRKKFFLDNLDEVEKHNAGKSSYKMGLNAFSDMSNKEFHARMSGGYGSTNDHRIHVYFY